MAITTLNNRAINRSDTASSGHLWTATSAVASDFQAAAAGGKVLQVLTASDNTQYAASADGIEYTQLELTMTPAATSSKIFVSVNLGLLGADAGADFGVVIKRTIGAGSATPLQVGSTSSACTFVPAMSSIGNYDAFSASHTLIDAPSTTSACKYEVFIDINSPRTIYINRRGADTSFSSGSSMHLMEIGA
jgi:hypothetical protein|tara:strand:- start:178 stop:750 length:573 start_codon:yes stop_codon:yes gene_type:complete